MERPYTGHRLRGQYQSSPLLKNPVSAPAVYVLFIIWLLMKHLNLKHAIFLFILKHQWKQRSLQLSVGMIIEMFKLMATILTKRKQKSMFPSRENVIFRSLKSEATSVILKEKSCSNQILYHYWL